MLFPVSCRRKIALPNLNRSGELRYEAQIKQRTNVVGVAPSALAITRLIGAMLLEQSDEWALQRRYMQLECLKILSDTASARLPAVQR